MISAHQKGKGKAQDFEDLEPVITYRHLLQQNPGVKDPLRVIALCDSDAFYAACEMIRLGVTDKPLVVLQWEGIIAVNYEARKFGITRFHKLKDAKERCPELMIVHVATYKEGEAEPGYWDLKDIDSRTHKVSLDYYRRESAKIHAMFKEGLPGAEIEKASIDEAFIDFTKPVRQALLQRYPYLSQIPPDGVDTPLPKPPPIEWDVHSNLVPINPDDVDSEDIQSGVNVTWHDVALQIAAEMMYKIKMDIVEKLGYTTSAGIARNKFLAKLCASYRKPNSQTILRNSAIPCYLKPLEFQKIRFLGGKLGEAIAKEYDVSTVADLLPVSLEDLQVKFGESALWIYEILRGIDRSEVKEKPSVNKSMMAAKALHRPITKVADGPHWIRVLAAELALRLNDARKVRPNLWPKTLVLHAGTGTSANWTSRSKQAAFPFVKEVTIDVIAAAGDKLWKELVGNVTPLKINHVSLSFTGIETSDESQQSIDMFFGNSHGIKRPIENVPDSPHKRSGKNYQRSPTPATHPHSRSLDNHLSPAQSAVSFTCPECHKTLSLSGKLLLSTVTLEERAQALLSMKNEHSDFHFAQSVAREVEPEPELDRPKPGSDLSRRKPKSSSLKQKKGNGSQGIQKFFSRT